jgi:hypothetical protein
VFARFSRTITPQSFENLMEIASPSVWPTSQSVSNSMSPELSDLSTLRESFTFRTLSGAANEVFDDHDIILIYKKDTKNKWLPIFCIFKVESNSSSGSRS